MKKLIKKTINKLGYEVRKIPKRDIYLKEISYIKNKKELSKLCEKYLKALLIHSYKNVPYYSKIFDKIGLIKNGKVDLKQFPRIPTLTKQIIREHFSELTSKDYNTRKWFYYSSSGSTGEPIKLIHDENYSEWEHTSVKFYYENILGINLNEVKQLILWGSEKEIFEKGSMIRIESKKIFLNSFIMNKENLSSYVETINLYKPELIRGYATSLYELCKYVKENKLTLHSPAVLVSSAQVLMEYMRKVIEKVFRTKVYDFYGSREVNAIAAECKQGKTHIFVFNNHTEILDKYNNPVKPGQEGKLVITNLHNYSMPIIRYEIEDMAILGEVGCECGSQLPLLNKITGKFTDHFFRKDGTMIHGEYFNYLFYGREWVKVFQIVQEGYTKIRILTILSGNVNDNEKKEIDNKIKIVMGEDTEIIWEFVDEIPKTPTGKYIFTKSLIEKNI